MQFAERYAVPPLEDLAKDSYAPKVDAGTPRKDGKGLEAFARIVYSLGSWVFAKHVDTTEYEDTVKLKLSKLMVSAFEVLFTPGNRNTAIPCDQDIIDYGYLNLAIVDMLNSPYVGCGLLERVSTGARTRFDNYKNWLKDFCPLANNWMLMAVIPEIYSLETKYPYDAMRIWSAVNLTLSNYKGDGIYGDGRDLHLNYYNSLVIHPVLDFIEDYESELTAIPNLGTALEPQRARSDRYAAVLERQFSPEGTFPVIGRSACYRLGIFHHLARGVSVGNTRCRPGALRNALQTCLNRLEPNMFRPDGYLKMGFNNEVENTRLAEPYISTSSLYATGFFLLPLAMSPTHPFWTESDLPWTQKRIWEGEDYSYDKDTAYSRNLIL